MDGRVSKDSVLRETVVAIAIGNTSLGTRESGAKAKLKTKQLTMRKHYSIQTTDYRLEILSVEG